MLTVMVGLAGFDEDVQLLDTRPAAAQSAAIKSVLFKFNQVCF